MPRKKPQPPVVTLKPSCLECPCSEHNELYDQRNRHTARYFYQLYTHILEMHGLCTEAGVRVLVKFVVYYLNKAVYNTEITRRQAADEFLMLLECEIGNVKNERQAEKRT